MLIIYVFLFKLLPDWFLKNYKTFAIHSCLMASPLNKSEK